MIVTELLLKPKKEKDKKKKVLKETSITPPAQRPINLGGVEFTPPFYSLGNDVTDVNHVLVCTCENPKVARALANFLWEHI